MTYLTDEELERMYRAKARVRESDSSVMLGVVLISACAGAVGFVAGCLYMAVRS